jgi:uncharacterized membrane protein YjfL (UPF0719 family)
VSLVDMAIWGSSRMLVQIAAYVVVKMLIPSITQDIEAATARRASSSA